jgi:hypothetical protein
MLNKRSEVPQIARFTLLAAALAGALTACGNKSAAPAPRTLQSIALDPPSLTVATGSQAQFAVIGSYSDNTTAAIGSGISWSSSSPTVAAMDDSGHATCTGDSTKAGTTTITATVGALTAQASLTVSPSDLLSITVDPGSVELPVSSTQGFSAVGHFADTTTATLHDVTWNSSDSSIAEVDSSGFGRGVKKGGPVAITATDSASGKSAFAVINVIDPLLQAITVSPASGSIPVGFSRLFTATGQFSDGTNKAIPVLWTSSNTAIATIDDTGLAFGLTAGQSVTITATAANGMSRTATLAVTAPVAPDPIAGNGSGTIGSNAPSIHRVTDLTPGTEYLVRVATSDPVELTTLLFEVHQDETFTNRVCGSWASGRSPTRVGGPPCRAGAADGSGNLFVQLTGPAGTEFRLDVSPLPIVTAGGSPVQGSVDTTETYFKLEGLAAGGTFQPTLATTSVPFDNATDLFAYDGPVTVDFQGVPLIIRHGPFGFSLIPWVAEGQQDPPQGSNPILMLGPPHPGALGSTVAATSAPKSFSVPATSPASGVAYATVEGWLTASGTEFAVSVTTAPPPAP